MKSTASPPGNILATVGAAASTGKNGRQLQLDVEAPNTRSTWKMRRIVSPSRFEIPLQCPKTFSQEQ